MNRRSRSCERLAVGERALQPVEHPVQRQSEPADLGARIGGLDAVRQVSPGDRGRGMAHAIQREQADAHDDQREGADQREDADDHDALDEQQLLERLVGVRERDRDDHRAAARGLGQDAVGALRRVHGLRAAGRDVRRQLGLGARVVHAEKGARRPAGGAQLPVGVGRARRRRARTAAGLAEEAPVGVGDLVLERRDGARELRVDAAEQEGTLRGVGHAADEHHAHRGQREHAGDQPPTQRGDHARGARNV